MPPTDQSRLDLVGFDAPAWPLIGFRAVLEEWFDDLSRWVRILGGPEAECDDIALRVFDVVRLRLHAIDTKNFDRWLYGLVQQQVQDFQRRARQI